MNLKIWQKKWWLVLIGIILFVLLGLFLLIITSRPQDSEFIYQIY